MRIKIVVGISLALIIASIALWSCQESKAKLDYDAALPISVSIQIIQPGELDRTLDVSGTLVGKNEASVISETQGKVEALGAHIGEWVNKGQTIVRIENDLKQVALEQAKAQLLAAQTNHAKAMADLKRYEELFGQQIATQSDIENARLGAQAAEAQLKGAEAAVKLAQRQFDDTFIKASLSGRLANRFVEEAAMVMPGQEIAAIVDNRAMKLKTSVAEGDIAQVHVGDPAKVLADALPGETFTGKVFSVAQKSNSERTYPVEILVDNSETESLKSGMFARGEIRTARLTAIIAIPDAAVLSDASHNTFVFIENAETAKRVTVATGLKQNDFVQIVSGLNVGDRLIVSGQQRLADGSKVAVR